MIDTHCHLDLEPLVLHLPKLLQEASAAGVTGFVVPGVHPDGWQQMSELATEYPQIMPAFGIHPMHAAFADDRFLADLTEQAQHGIAIGEIGLDPSYPVEAAIQENAFREQLRVAVKLGLPVLVHCRKVFQRTIQIMREERVVLVGGDNARLLRFNRNGPRVHQAWIRHIYLRHHHLEKCGQAASAGQ